MLVDSRVYKLRAQVHTASSKILEDNEQERERGREKERESETGRKRECGRWKSFQPLKYCETAQLKMSHFFLKDDESYDNYRSIRTALLIMINI